MWVPLITRDKSSGTMLYGAVAETAAYREVCSGRTGHAEAVQLTYQTGSVGYGELVEFFYRTHDPTTVDAQGPDRGSRKSSPPVLLGAIILGEQVTDAR